MITTDLRKANTLIRLKHKCPCCDKNDHIWLQVYTDNQSKLDKIENAYLTWCKQQNDYVFIMKKSFKLKHSFKF